MSRYKPDYSPIHKPTSTVDNEAFQDYKKKAKFRDVKKLNYYTNYRRVVRKVWSRVANDSINYESGVYDKDFFYLVPQVVDNKPFIELPNGKIKTNFHTDGDIYYPIFCNLSKKLEHSCWSLEGGYVATYKKKLRETINKFIPKYYFILSTLIKNKL